jgi:hypothetical protein
MLAYPGGAHSAIYGGQTRTLDAAGIASGNGPVRREAASAQTRNFDLSKMSFRLSNDNLGKARSGRLSKI